MSKSLLINGLEVNYINRIAISKKTLSLSDLSAQTLNYSKDIEVERDRISDVIFKNAHTQTSNASKFNETYTYSYKENGQILTKGIAILKEATNTSYKVQLLDQAKEFFDALNRPLSDLDFDGDDFTFNTTNYDILKVETASVWIWPAINNHITRLNANTILYSTGFKTAYSRPSFNVAVIYDKILSDNNWTENNTDRSLLNKLVMTSNHNNFFVNTYKKTFSNKTYISVTTFTLNNWDTFDFSYIPGTQVASNTSIVNFQDEISLNFRGTITSTADCELKVYVVPTSVTFILKIFSGTRFYNITSPETYNNLGVPGAQSILVDIVGAATVTFVDTVVTTVLQEEKTWDGASPPTVVGIKNNTLLGYLVRYNSNIENMSQLDFLKQIWSLTGSFIDVDNLEKKINIYNLNDVSTLDKQDLSSKYIRSSGEVSKIQNLSQVNYFKYSNDSMTDEDTGTNQIDITDLNLTKENDYLTSIYSASSNAEIPNFAATKNFTLGDMPVYDTTEDRLNSGTVRLLEFEQPAGEAFTIANFIELDFINLIPSYFDLLVNALDNPEILTANFNLSDKDFFGLELNKPVYIGSMGSTYFILEINDYISGQLTEMVLLKLR